MKEVIRKIINRAGTVQINACGDSRLRGLRSRKPIGFRQWVVHDDIVFVTNEDFNRAFMVMCSADCETLKKEYGVEF